MFLLIDRIVLINIIGLEGSIEYRFCMVAVYRTFVADMTALLIN